MWILFYKKPASKKPSTKVERNIKKLSVLYFDFTFVLACLKACLKA